MKTLLVNPPIRDIMPPGDYPYGLALIASMLKKNGIPFDVLDINAYRYDKKDVLKLLRKKDYSFIATGGLITTYSYIKWFTREAKRIHPRAKTIIGGGVATWDPKFVLENIKPDLVVSGEGEETLPEVIKNFDFENMNNGKPFPGAAFMDLRGRYIFQPRNLIEDLDSLPMPAWEKFPMGIYISNSRHRDLKRGVDVYSARGCPMNCSFCYHIFGRGIRLRSTGRVIEEIKALQRLYSLDHIDFTDECFTLNKKRIMEFCDAYIKAGINLPFRVWGRLDTVNEETATLLVRAGCVFYGVGIESGSRKILKNMQKKITPETMISSMVLLKEKGLLVSPTFIHGMTGENETTVRESIDFCKTAGLKNVRPFFIQPYPGAPMWQGEVARKILEKYKSLERYLESLDDASRFTVNISEVSDKRLFALRNKIIAETSGTHIFSYYMQELFRKLKRVKDRGLIWAVSKMISEFTKGAKNVSIRYSRNRH